METKQLISREHFKKELAYILNERIIHGKKVPFMNFPAYNPNYDYASSKSYVGWKIDLDNPQQHELEVGYATELLYQTRLKELTKLYLDSAHAPIFNGGERIKIVNTLKERSELTKTPHFINVPNTTYISVTIPLDAPYPGVTENGDIYFSAEFTDNENKVVSLSFKLEEYIPAEG